LLSRVQLEIWAFVTPDVTPSAFQCAFSSLNIPNKSLILKMERVKGIEPSSSAWKAFAPSPGGFGVQFFSAVDASGYTATALPLCGNLDQRGQRLRGEGRESSSMLWSVFGGWLVCMRKHQKLTGGRWHHGDAVHSLQRAPGGIEENSKEFHRPAAAAADFC
jgi:hypothetical protein